MNQINKYYFIGIGGIGMSSIARFLLAKGQHVAGYDKTTSDLITDLCKLGAVVTFGETTNDIPEGFENELVKVIYTPAIPASHPQLTHFKSQSNSVVKRAVFLGELTLDTYTLAVAGTHGKTTTTSILAHLFSSLSQSFTAFVGGILKGHDTNMLSTGTDFSLVEADEFDRSFLQLKPTIGCITSVDADHLDIYGSADEVYKSYSQFASQVITHLIVEKQVPIKGITYSISDSKADYHTTNIKTEGFGYRFNLHTPKNEFVDIYFSQLGLHNLSNAIAAFAMADKSGLDNNKLLNALGSFPGVARRLELVVESKEHILIDDYAHHPTEIKAVYDTLEDAFPKEKKCVIFQPHLYSRTSDFMDDFARSLSLFERVILIPIYPARERPIEGINSKVLADKIGSHSMVSLVEKINLVDEVSAAPERIKIVLGAGDIGLEVQKLKNKLLGNAD